MTAAHVENWIAHIAVVGFHHKLGNNVEFIYPPLKEEIQVLYSWDLLPFLALPDGSHNSQEDYCYFILPKRTTALQSVTHPTTTQSDIPSPPHTLYGVACFRQISSKDLTAALKTSDVTRSHVQKSVCILSYLPFFGAFKQRLSVVTQNYIGQCKFSDTSLLEAVYHSFNYAYPVNREISSPYDLYAGLQLQTLVQRFGRNLMVLFKAMLIEQSMVIFSSSPVSIASTTLLSITSLLPGFMQLLNPFISKELANDQYVKFGLPFPVYQSGEMILPYVALQQMGYLNTTKSPFAVASSNVLYGHHPPNSTSIIVEAANNSIRYKNESIPVALILTSDDRKFIDGIFSKVIKFTYKSSTEIVNGEGSDEWIRESFLNYTQNLLYSISQVPNIFEKNIFEDTELSSLEKYNLRWINEFMATPCFVNWKKTFSNITKRDELISAASELAHSLPTDEGNIATTVVKAAGSAVTKVLQTSSSFSKLLFIDDIISTDGDEGPQKDKKGNRSAHQSLEISREKADEYMMRSRSMSDLSGQADFYDGEGPDTPTINALKGSYKWAKESSSSVVSSGKMVISSFVNIVKSASSYNLHDTSSLLPDPTANLNTSSSSSSGNTSSSLNLSTFSSLNLSSENT